MIEGIFEQQAIWGAGRSAIEDAVRRLAPEVEPLVVAPPVPAILGGTDPLEAVLIIARKEPVPHWHYVGLGLAELEEKTWPDPEWSGWGFELTFRLAGDATEPPRWPVWFLQRLAKHVLRTGQGFAPGSLIDLQSPLTQTTPTALRALLFVRDPELGMLDIPTGRLQFLQAVGLHAAEHRRLREPDGIPTFLAAARERWPLLITDLRRDPLWPL
jgi:hypothetical protein